MQGTADVTFIYKLKVEREEENQDWKVKFMSPTRMIRGPADCYETALSY